MNKIPSVIENSLLLSRLPKAVKDSIKSLSFYQSKQWLYKNPKGFVAWTDLLAEIIYEGTLGYKQSLDRFDVISALVCKQAMLEDSPLRCLGLELAQAFLVTKLCEIDSRCIAFDHFIISLPNGVLKDDLGANVFAVIVSTWSALVQNAAKRGLDLQFPFDDSGGGGFVLVGLSGAGSHLVDCISFKSVGEPPTHIDVDNSLQPFVNEVDMCDAIVRLRRIAINSLLSMAFKPELVTSEKVPPVTVAKGFGGVTSVQRPRVTTWIGKNFSRSVRIREKSDELEGAPKAPHWRSGHWHTVRHGPNREQARLVWFQPVYVNALVASTDA